MTIEELKKQTELIVNDAFEKFKQDSLLDDEENQLVLELSKLKMLKEVQDSFDKQIENSNSCIFVLENSELYLDIIRVAIDVSLNDGDKKLLVKAITNYYNKYLEWRKTNE